MLGTQGNQSLNCPLRLPGVSAFRTDGGFSPSQKCEESDRKKTDCHDDFPRWNTTSLSQSGALRTGQLHSAISLRGFCEATRRLDRLSELGSRPKRIH